MVVIVLISWESPEGMSPGHANEKLQKKIEILGKLIKSSNEQISHLRYHYD